VVSELRGEKIDIIPWSEDIVRFACNSLQPAQVSKVYIEEDISAMEIIVADDQLSLAIGKRGQNVRLAARLTGWKLDIKSESRAAEAELLQFATFDGTAPEDEVAGEEGPTNTTEAPAEEEGGTTGDDLTAAERNDGE